MKIFFMGATKFSVRCLKALLECEQEIVGCALTDEVFKISYNEKGVKNCNYASFADLAKEHNIAAIPYERKRPKNFREKVMSLQPDLIFVAGWYYFVSEKLRNIAPLGAIGLHGSLLPKYRGGAPLVWAMINGEKETGISLFYLDEGTDTGDVIGQERFPIAEDETIAEVMAKMEKAAVCLIKNYVPKLASGNAPRIVQDESAATIFPQRCPDDGKIDWAWSPKQIRDFVRAQTRPYPGAYTIIGGKKVTIWDCSVEVDE